MNHIGKTVAYTTGPPQRSEAFGEEGGGEPENSRAHKKMKNEKPNDQEEIIVPGHEQKDIRTSQNGYRQLLHHHNTQLLYNDNNDSDEIRPDETNFHVQKVGNWRKNRGRTVVLKTQLHSRLLVKTICTRIHRAIVSRCNGRPGHARPHIRLRSPG